MQVDRPLGSLHPRHHSLRYELNYGFIPNTLADDGQEVDAYLICVERPVEHFDGICIAILHRLNDVEDKLVIAPNNTTVSDAEILEQTRFQEKFFDTKLLR
ncbi:inorganic diphosphatase [Algirhabdus cladophorae]|uniref:inorganic diphosphatase n=1 Tax=Algirhabdus cladophorae TaxID=3377108 RepID=UPI003B8456D8